MNMWVILIASIVSGLCGRAGGSGRYPRQTRVIGVPFIIMAQTTLSAQNTPIWALCLTFGLLCASISTYFDFIPIGGVKADRFFLHGFFIGLSLLPVAIVTKHYFGFGMALGICTLWMGFWHWVRPQGISGFGSYMDGAVEEEFFRYSILPTVVWLLLR